jgi:HAE1 family hydrophobic/amphiphilic exporter-1
VGINAKEIAGAINVAFSSDVKTSSFEENGKEFDIVVKFDDKYRTDIESLKKMQLKSSSGEMVLIDGLVEFEEASTLVSINRFNRERSVNVYADLFGLDLGGAVGYTMAKINSLLPDDVSFKFSGFAEEMGKTAKSFGTAILISIILMYIILAVLYESLIQPIIIMVALPLSIVGVLVSLFLTGHHFSLFVMIGFMLLMGMVGKNAVLLVDFANHAIEKGKSVNEALVEAGRKRLRPILMTTTAMVFGMLPLVIHGGYGVETKAPMAISIIGGLISSMFLTLFIIPVIYKLIIPFDLWLKKFYSQKID